MDQTLHMIADDIIKKIQQTNQTNAIKGAPVHALPEILSQKKITHLRDLAKAVSVKYYGKLDRETLIQQIQASLTDPQIASACLLSSSTEEWDLFKRAVSADSIEEEWVDPYYYLPLQLAGMIQSFWHDNRLCFVVADEIKGVYHQLLEGGFAEKKAHYDSVEQHAIAAVNLYGAIPVEDFIELFNGWNQQPITNVDLYMILGSKLSREPGYLFWCDYLVSDEFDEEYEDDLFETIEEFLRDRGSKPRYVPGHNEFLRYVELGYFEQTPQTKALERYLADRLKDPRDAAILVGEIHDMCMAQDRLQDIFDMLEDAEVRIQNDSDLERLARLIMEVWNTTRMWVNHAHTPSELSHLEPGFRSPPKQQPLASSKKPGRNEPCPCGSGKKYKNCCGSN